MKISESILSLFVAAILLLAARALAACTASQPQAAATVAATVTVTAPATQRIQFDPASITPSADQPVLAGECVESVRVPRTGAYSCAAETGATFDPCFVLGESDNLGCQPNPPAGRYSAIVRATNTPLPAREGAAEPLPFYLKLEAGKPSAGRNMTFHVLTDGMTFDLGDAAP